MNKLQGGWRFFIFTIVAFTVMFLCVGHAFALRPAVAPVNLTGNWNDPLQAGSVWVVSQQGSKITANLVVKLNKENRGTFPGQITSPNTVYIDFKHTIYSTGTPTPCCAGGIADNNTIRWTNGAVWTRSNEGGDTPNSATMPHQPPQVFADPAPPQGRSYTSNVLRLGGVADLTGQWVFSYGKAKLALSLTQSGSSIQGQTVPVSNVPIPLSGSVSGDVMELFLTFTETHYAAFSKNPNLAKAIGNITAKATFNVGTNPNMLSGTFYPEYADWRKDAAGNYTIIKKYERGETHPSKPPQPCTLTRTVSGTGLTSSAGDVIPGTDPASINLTGAWNVSQPKPWENQKDSCYVTQQGNKFAVRCDSKFTCQGDIPTKTSLNITCGSSMFWSYSFDNNTIRWSNGVVWTRK